MHRHEPRLRVLTYNIHKGFSPLGRTYVLKEMRHAIHRMDCQLAFLQEVVGMHRRHADRIAGWAAKPQADYLAEPGWPFVVYHKNRSHRHGHHGNAILSKAPVLHSEHINITTNRLERRGMLHSVLAWPTPDCRLHALCVHLDLLEAGRRTQVKDIVARIRSHVPDDEPLIVAGDFNDWRERLSPILRHEAGLHEAFQVATGRHAPSFPGGFPMLPLDRIYVRGLTVDRVEVPKGKDWGRLSDHAPLAVTLRPAARA